MRNFLKPPGRLVLPGEALSPRARKELSEADVVRAFQDIEAGSPSVRAFLEVTLDLAAGYSESALAFGIPTEARIYYAGTAAGLRKLAEHVMQLHATKPPPLEEKAKAGTARRGSGRDLNDTAQPLRATRLRIREERPPESAAATG